MDRRERRRRQRQVKRMEEKIGKEVAQVRKEQRAKGYFGIGVSRAWELIVGASVVIGLVVAYFVFRPDVGIEPYAQLNPREAFSTEFRISNNGLLAIHNLTSECVLKDLEDSLHNRFTSSSIGTTRGSIAVLESKKSTTIRCPVAAPSAIVAKAEIAFTVSFRPDLWPFLLVQDHSFIGTKDSEGVIHWLPRAN